MKRLGIFVFYDKEGIVDNYVLYLLESLKEHLTNLIIVCNGNVTASGKSKLEQFSDRVYIRENTGYDAMAYKLAMAEYCGWNEVLEYDEVLMFNDTFFGPLYPFSEVFDKMQNQECDFWGLTYHAKAIDYFYGTNDVLPAHIHTFFSVYRKPVLASKAFQSYWNAFDSTEWFFSDVVRHEQFFTKYLEEAGFTWSAYIDAAEYNSDEPSSNFNHYYYIANELIRDYRCPIIKRKNFVIKHMSMQAGNNGEDIANALKTIETNTSYDTDMIWENILRLYNVTEIKNALHLDYVLPWKQREMEEPAELYKMTAVIAHLYYEELLPFCLKYLKQVPWKIHLYITSSKEGICQEVEKAMTECGRQNYQVMHIPNKGRDMGALFVACKDILKQYEYVCFVHDKKTKSSIGPATIGKSFLYNMWENMLKSSAYVDNVLNLFTSNRRLGFLAPPQPVHAEFFGSIGMEWHNDYENTMALAEKIGVKANFSPDIPCFALANVFWCRTKAIMPLADYGLSYEELPKEPMPMDGTISHAIERIYPYVAQSQGYYSGIVMNTDYASLQNTNLYYYLSGALSKMRMQYMLTDYESMFDNDILSYCRNREKLLIYGAGTNGIKISNILSNNGIAAEGFIVSDDQPKQQEKNGLPIYRLSEIPYEKSEIGIIVSVAYTRDRREILNNLQEKGYKDYYLI